MVKILLINIRIYLNINKQTKFEYDFWAKVKALLYFWFTHRAHCQQSIRTVITMYLCVLVFQVTSSLLMAS